MSMVARATVVTRAMRKLDSGESRIAMRVPGVSGSWESGSWWGAGGWRLARKGRMLTMVRSNSRLEMSSDME